MKTEFITYEDQGTVLEGFIAYPHAPSTKAPGVILCHAWSGRDQFVIEKAKEMAKLGYIGFALDVYGKGIVGSSKTENAALMTPFMENRNLLQRRLHAGLKAFKDQAALDVKKIAVMGFCFGGLCALDLARSGADLKGVISVHGLLNKPEEARSKPIVSKVLALTGFDDPMVSPAEVLAFEKEMTAADVDWQLTSYGKTMHAFTNPAADDPKAGTVYNPVVAKRAWASIHHFLAECFL